METVRFSGLRQFDRALGKANKELRAQLRGDLRDIAEIVATEARSLASQRTVRRSGDLIAGIRPFALTGRAGVRSSARHRGYPYPRRLEFEGRSGGATGPRASLIPAFEKHEAEVFAKAEQLLGRLVDDLAR